jgi:signal transduction histidine kinase
MKQGFWHIKAHLKWKPVLLVLFICIAHNCFAQPLYKDTLYLQKINPAVLSEYYTYFASTGEEPPAKIDTLFREGLFKHWKWHKTFNPSDIENKVWFRVAVTNTLKDDENFLWAFYSNADSITLFRKDGNEAIKQIAFASGLTPLSQRRFGRRNFSLPFKLNASESTVLYARVVHLGSRFYLPINITSTEDYLTKEATYLVRKNWYFLIGFFVFASIFNLILFFFLKDTVHLWYCSYVISSLIFLLLEDRLDALIFPDPIYFFCRRIGQFSFLLFASAFGIGVMQSFIKQPPKTILYSIGKVIIIFDLVFVILNALLYQSYRSGSDVAISKFLTTFRDIALALSILITIISLVQQVLKKNKLAYYYSFTFLFFLAGSIIFYLNNNGLSNIHWVEPNQLAIGIFVELLLLLFFITMRFQAIVKENSQMKIKELEQQKRMSAQIILVQDEERQRLARDLHDDLGNTVSRIHLLLTKIRSNETDNQHVLTEMQELIKKAHTDVRNISHELMPVDLQEKGLFGAMQDMAAFLSQYSGIAFRFFSSGQEKDISYELQLVIYRMFNELSNNIIKHSNASHAELQCILHETSVLVSAEDNGRGIYRLEQSNGIGLQNIKTRVQYLHGKINIDSSESGLTIIIEIPN